MCSENYYDVAIIGLGPAGSTLARLLNKNLKVVAIDKKSCTNNNKGYQKPCGGLLAPDAQRAISKLGLTLPKELLVDPQIFAVKTIDIRQKLLRNYQRFYINLDRHKFDKWLMSLIPPSVDVFTESACVKIEKNNEVYIIHFKTDNKVNTIKARYIAGADGANSIVRRQLFPKHKIRKYIAIQQWFKDVNAEPFYSAIFDKSITDSYCWSISKDGFFIIGGAFPLKNAKKRFKRLKKKASLLGFGFDNSIKTESCSVLRPTGPFSICVGNKGAFLLGEAAGLISPSSLEGISYAFDSACLLAKSLNQGNKDPNRLYNIKTVKLRIKIAVKNTKSVFICSPILRKLIMLSGFQSINTIKKSN